jgi:hypothetical protein
VLCQTDRQSCLGFDRAGAAPPATDDAWTCQLIIDAGDPGTAAYVRQVITNHLGPVIIQTAWAPGRGPQLRCDMGERSRLWYQTDVAAVDQLLAVIAASGASVRYNTRPGRRSGPAE